MTQINLDIGLNHPDGHARALVYRPTLSRIYDLLIITDLKDETVKQQQQQHAKTNPEQ